VKELPERGDTMFMERTGEPLQIAERVGEGGQGVVHRATLRTGAPLAVKWYRSSTNTVGQRKAVTALAATRTPHEAFLFPLDTVTGNLAGFGYAMPWLDSRFSPFAKLINDPKPPGLQTKAKIGRKLAEAFGALHASGLCYRDINFSNLCVDPLAGDIAIIDNDNVGLDDGHVAVWGVPRFMAPEVIQRKRKPSTITDLHSLAVLLFYLFCHGHPLEGAKLESAYTWSQGRRKSDEELAIEAYGTSPVFSFDPNDDSNRPVPGYGPALWWPIYPGFLRKLFVQAFTVGLKDASLSGRVVTNSWREALVQLGDLCTVCPDCGAALVYDPDEPDRACWRCAGVPPRQPMLRLRGGRHTVLLSSGTRLASNHITHDRDYDTTLAEVEQHPRAGLVLRNRSQSMWMSYPVDGEARPVAPGQAFAFRPARIDFGSVQGELILPPTE
jgi:DNA-binding helix-hairpin-helix protein with protein kinase domain